MGHLKTVQSTCEQHSESALPIELDDAELNDLFADCLPRLYGAARKILNNHEDSEDALQDGLLLAYRKLHQFEGRSSFATWLYSIVRNTAKGHYRSAKAHPVYSTDEEFFGDSGQPAENLFVDAKPDPEQIYASVERSQLLRSTAHALPRKYGAAIDQFYSKGVGEAQAARNLGITVAALKARLYRARILLARRMRQSGIHTTSRKLLSARPVPHRRRPAAFPCGATARKRAFPRRSRVRAIC